MQTEANPGGLPKRVFDDIQEQVAANRSEFYRELPATAFYGFNRPGAKPVEAIIQNWWRQGMMGGAKAHYDGVVAFSQTDFTEDLKKITVPVLVMHGDDDQVVPVRRLRPAVRGAAAERHAQDVRRLPARHADHPGRDDQRRPPGVHPLLSTDAEGGCASTQPPSSLQRPPRIASRTTVNTSVLSCARASRSARGPSAVNGVAAPVCPRSSSRP